MRTQMTQPTQTLQKEVKAEKKTSLTKIMVLTDFSEVSDLALQYALALARRYDARLYMTHILSPDTYALAEPGLAELTYQELRQAAEQSFGDILISGKLRGVPHETLLYEGSLWPTVERLIKERGIDLVVSGTHGRGDLKKVVIGSVAEEVFRQAGCAVLTVGPQVRKQAPHEVELNNILFATDFGLGAARAAKYAFSLAQEYGARLTVLRVVEELRAHSREEEERVRKVNVQHMMEFMPAGSEDWCKVDFRVAFGAPVEEILDEARETGADLIIMGAKTSRAFPGHAPLTIAYNVVAKAKCPVLTVRG
jgi:nucleotide-binding universal stress UspA family protein